MLDWLKRTAPDPGPESRVIDGIRVDVLNTQIPAAERQAAEKTARSFTPKPMDRAANDPPTLAEVAP